MLVNIDLPQSVMVPSGGGGGSESRNHRLQENCVHKHAVRGLYHIILYRLLELMQSRELDLIPKAMTIDHFPLGVKNEH